jgi:hypothetical protein
MKPEYIDIINKCWMKHGYTPKMDTLACCMKLVGAISEVDYEHVQGGKDQILKTNVGANLSFLNYSS